MYQRLILILGFSVSITLSRTTEIQMFCPNHDPQKNFDIKLLMGTWHIVEIVHHRSSGENLYMQDLTLDTCPVIQLVQDSYSNIKLVWEEETATLYYHAKKTDPHNPGFWVASGPHKTDAEEHFGHHVQYTGTIEVMKAVSNHAVLTFCKSDHSDSQLFSIVIARDTWITREDTRGVNKMLTTRGLRPVLIKKTCSGAAKNIVITTLVLVLTTLALIT